MILIVCPQICMAFSGFLHAVEKCLFDIEHPSPEDLILLWNGEIDHY